MYQENDKKQQITGSVKKADLNITLFKLKTKNQALNEKRISTFRHLRNIVKEVQSRGTEFAFTKQEKQYFIY